MKLFIISPPDSQENQQNAERAPKERASSIVHKIPMPRLGECSLPASRTRCYQPGEGNYSGKKGDGKKSDLARCFFNFPLAGEI